MNCDRVQKLLASFTADAVRTGLKARIQDHLETCPACRKEHEAIVQTMLLVESLPRAEPGRDLWAGVYSSIGRPAPARSLRPALARAALAVGLAGAIAFAAGRYVSPPEPTAVAKTAGPMAPYIQQHMALAGTGILADPTNAGLVESVSEP